MKTNELYTGAGTARISFPQALFPHEGFSGTHDDPAARVLILDCGEKTSIVCLELVMLDRDDIAAAKQIISDVAGIKHENIWVHVTHAITTPHAPHAPRGMGGVALEISEDEKKTLKDKIALFRDAVMAAIKDAAQKAAADLRAATMGLGTCQCAVNMNRDVETPNGWWINFDPNGPSNHTVTVLRFDDKQGKLIAALISFGLKPCAIDNSEMEKNTRLISSDVPGLACTILEEELGAPVLFAMSAAGDQVPLEQAWFDVVEEDGTVRKVDNGVQAGLKIVDRLGRRMAEDIGPAIRAIACDQISPEIRLSNGGIEWPGKSRGKMVPTKTPDYVENGIEYVGVEMMIIGDVALVGLKPEICAATEAQLQAESPFEHTLVVSMVNGGQKYMPDQASYDNITWEAQSAPVMPGAAEAWVKMSVELLNNLKGDQKMIDFSCKHDILIKNPDGSFSHMDEPWFEAEKIAPNTWKILSSGDFSYLVVGENEGISIDTGYGAGNIREYLQTLTDKPVRNVINTHHHFDHTASNPYFEKAYMHPNAFDFATIPYASFVGIDFPRDYEFVAVHNGDTYELGGRTLEFFWIPDHTPDGIAILDRKERIFYIGDELMPMPMGKTLKVPLKTFYGYMEMFMAHRHEYDRVYSGGGLFDIDYIEKYYNCAKEILNGNYGVPHEAKRGGPREMPPGPNGELVYDRRMPHFGDGGSGKDTPAGNLYCLEYGGVKIVYDRDLL